jgi:hypothetical protein
MPSAAATAYRFDRHYSRVPHVVATPTGDPATRFWIGEITEGGFTVHVAKPLLSELTFNFIAQE